jgi:hypothetical protein
MFGSSRDSAQPSQATHHQLQSAHSMNSPPATPQQSRMVNLPQQPRDPPIMSSDALQASVEALEIVLKTMDQVRDQTNRYNAALREHARGLRGYAANIQLIATRDEDRQGQGQQRGSVGVRDERVPERLLVHCANYYDRLADAQDQLVLSPYLPTFVVSSSFLFYCLLFYL